MNRFTMADVVIHFALTFGESLELSKQYQPQTLAYMERLRQRPAYKAAVAEENASLASFEANGGAGDLKIRQPDWDKFKQQLQAQMNAKL